MNNQILLLTQDSPLSWAAEPPSDCLVNPGKTFSLASLFERGIPAVELSVGYSFLNESFWKMVLTQPGALDLGALT